MTDILQPLDRSCFGHAEILYRRQICRNFYAGLSPTKAHFFETYQSIRKEECSPQNHYRKGWRKCRLSKNWSRHCIGQVQKIHESWYYHARASCTRGVSDWARSGKYFYPPAPQKKLRKKEKKHSKKHSKKRSRISNPNNKAVRAVRMANSGPHSPVQRTDPGPNYVSKIKVKQNLLLVYIYFSVWLEIIFFFKIQVCTWRW